MNNEQINQIIQGLGALSEMWVIVYKNFKDQGFNDDLAINHTKALMSVMMNEMFSPNGGAQ